MIIKNLYAKITGRKEEGVIWALVVSLWRVLFALRDLVVLKCGIPSKRNGYAFLIHARDITDVRRHMPFLNPTYIPESWIQWITWHCWPLAVSRIKGLKNKDGQSVPGWVITIPLTAEQMMNKKGLRQSRKRIFEAAILADRLGASMVGLGALTASLTKNGIVLRDQLIGVSDIKITTGHAFTTYVAIETLREISNKLGDDLSSQTVAIVGAAGSIGSSCRYLLNGSVGKLILIDLPSRQSELEILASGKTNVMIGTDLRLVRGAGYVITATSDIHAILKPEHLSPGTVIIDDAQPVNCTAEVAAEAHCLLLHVVARTPGIRSNFDMGVHGSENNYACLGELMALVSEGRLESGNLGRVTNAQVDQISEWASRQGFGVAHFQSFGHPIPESDIRLIRNQRRESQPVGIGGRELISV